MKFSQKIYYSIKLYKIYIVKLQIGKNDFSH